MISEAKLRKQYKVMVDAHGKTELSDHMAALSKSIKAYDLGRILEIPEEQVTKDLQKARSKWLSWFNSKM